jgi:hypothetical protein
MLTCPPYSAAGLLPATLFPSRRKNLWFFYSPANPQNPLFYKDSGRGKSVFKKSDTWDLEMFKKKITNPK